MRMQIEGPPERPLVKVWLSERNLKGLLIKLHQPGSTCMLLLEEDGMSLLVTAESDEQHYDREPGPMHPATEGLLHIVSDDMISSWSTDDEQ